MDELIGREIVKNLECLFRDRDNQPLPPYFYEYFKHWNLSAGLRSYIQYCYDLWCLSEACGKKVLDAGCGFGLISILFKAFGSSMVVGLDEDSEKIYVCNEILRRTTLNQENLIFVRGDCLNLPFDEETFDAVIAVEVISHVRSLSRFIYEVRRVLKKDGVIFVSDGNNALNPTVYLRQKSFQIRAERGSVNGTGLVIPYIEMRRRIIMEEFPDLSEDITYLLARGTEGLWGQKILEVVKKYIITKSMPKMMGRNNFVNPLTGEIPERLFNPMKVGRLLKKSNFDVELIAPLPTRFSIKINKLLPNTFKYAIFPFAKSFWINARKRN